MIEQIEVIKEEGRYYFTGEVSIEDGWVRIKTIRGEDLKFRTEQINQRNVISDGHFLLSIFDEEVRGSFDKYNITKNGVIDKKGNFAEQLNSLVKAYFKSLETKDI